MYKVSCILVCCILLVACGNRENDITIKNTDSAHNAATGADSVDITTDVHGLWVAEFDDSTGKLRMKKTKLISTDSLIPAYLIHQMNMQYPNVYLNLTKISGDTIFVKIEKSNFLTSQMGSTGADVYMTEVTYNLTELKNIEYVCFDFKEGDHAAPGTYSRTDFVNVLH